MEQLVDLPSNRLRTERESVRDSVRRQRIKRGRGYYRKSIERITKVRACADIVNDWPVERTSLEWWGKALAVWLPPPAMTIDGWADTTRKIAGDFAAEPGDWHTDKCGFMREIMRACSPNDPCSRVVLVKSAQTSGTESAILNTIGFHIDVNPRSMLVIFPTLDLAQSFAKERLEPMVEICPSLKDKVGDVGRAAVGKIASTIMKKRYPGGFLNLAGANSTSGLSSRPVPIVMMDEVDRCIQNAGREGNPTALLAVRASTFIDRKEIYISSPANPKGTSGIIQMFEDGTQEEWFVRCPACEREQVLEWEQLDLYTAELTCMNPDCMKKFPQWQWEPWNEEKGRWISAKVHPNTRSFKINGLTSPWLVWQDLILEWKEANRVLAFGDNSLMRVFINTRLARNFEAVGKKVEVDLYGVRREVYDCRKKGAELPDGVILLTAAIDVQDSYLAYEVVGWGRGRESWGIEYGEFQGDPAAPDQRVWQLADEFIHKRLFHYTNGDRARVKLCFVDSSGHKTNSVYAYTKARHPRVISIRGVGGIGHGIIVGGKRREGGSNVWIVRLGVDTLKDELFARLEINKHGPGYCHYPMEESGMDCCGYSKDYFDQLTAEQRVLKYSKGGFAKYEWQKNRTDANEALDIRNYNRAALEYLRVKLEQMPRDILSDKQLQQMKIEEVEISGRKMMIDNREVQIQRKSNVKGGRYGGTTLEGSEGSLFSTDEPRQQKAASQVRRTTRYGSVGTSF